VKLKKQDVRTKYDRMFERKNQDVLADHYAKMVTSTTDDADRLDGQQSLDDDLFSVKRRIPVEDEDEAELESEEEDTLDPDVPGAKSIMIPGAKAPLILDSKRREKLLKSKKKLLKLKEKGTKLVFDDEGKAHAIYELADEDMFKSAGTAEEQRKRFLLEEAERVKEADMVDKAAVKDKRRAKKEKRKERERAEAEEDEGVELAGGENEDGLANFIADAAGSDEASGSEVEEDHEPQVKRQKKWFEEDGKVKRGRKVDAEPETLEDLEALASGLLG